MLNPNKPSMHLGHRLDYVRNLPLTTEELADAITEGIAEAKDSGKGSVILTWAGLFDVICYAGGTFAFVDTTNVRHYSLHRDDGRPMIQQED